MMLFFVVFCSYSWRFCYYYVIVDASAGNIDESVHIST